MNNAYIWHMVAFVYETPKKLLHFFGKMVYRNGEETDINSCFIDYTPMRDAEGKVKFGYLKRLTKNNVAYDGELYEYFRLGKSSRRELYNILKEEFENEQ